MQLKVMNKLLVLIFNRLSGVVAVYGADTNTKGKSPTLQVKQYLFIISREL